MIQPDAKTAIAHSGDLVAFLAEYEYQPALTAKLDLLSSRAIDQSLLNEIVLWKIDRYVMLAPEAAAAIEWAREIKPREHRQAQHVLETLLEMHGVALPMASAILRFRNPSAFQIIDRHAYRAVYGRHFPLTPASPKGKSIKLYNDYLDQLHELCAARNLAFSTIDRLLYVFDKRVNGSLTSKAGNL